MYVQVAGKGELAAALPSHGASLLAPQGNSTQH